MHIVQIITSTLGGAGEHLYQNIRHAQQPGVEFTVVGAMDGSVPAKLRELGVRLIDFPFEKNVSLISDLKTTVGLVRLLRSLKPDLVHTHCAKAGLIGRTAARLALRVPIVHTPHGFPFVKTGSGPRRWAYVYLERFGAALCDRIITVSRKEWEDGVQYVTSDRKLCIIYNGIPVTDFSAQCQPPDFRKKFGIPEDAIIIGCVARLTEQKAPHILVEAVERLVSMDRQVHLVFVGEGHLEGELRSRAHKLGVSEQVHFEGWRSDVSSIYRSFNLVALSSAWEAFGLVLVEAMASGVPVVASRVDGIPEVVSDGESGLLAEPGNPDDFARVIKQLLDSPDLEKRLTETGREVVKQRFSAERMAMETMKLYRSLLNR